MLKNLLYWLTGKLPCRIISEDDTPYLERYYVGTAFGVRFYIHRFVGSDPAWALHDHPWKWAKSIILSGWYIEERLSRAHKVKWFNSLTGDTFHRVVLPKNRECWTLFFHNAEYVKPWGFLKLKSDQETKQTTTEWTPWNYPKDGTASKNEWWKVAEKGINHPLRKELK